MRLRKNLSIIGVINKSRLMMGLKKSTKTATAEGRPTLGQLLGHAQLANPRANLAPPKTASPMFTRREKHIYVLQLWTTTNQE
jgi:hypothetical protein